MAYKNKLGLFLQIHIIAKNFNFSRDPQMQNLFKSVVFLAISTSSLFGSQQFNHHEYLKRPYKIDLLNKKVMKNPDNNHKNKADFSSPSLTFFKEHPLLTSLATAGALYFGFSQFNNYSNQTSRHGLESTGDFVNTLDKDSHAQVSSFLEEKDFINLSQTNVNMNDMLSNTPNSIGYVHRENSNFSVKDIEGKVYYLNEYLSQNVPIQISGIKNITQLVKERPDDFKKLVLASIPKTRDDIKNNLESYYKETMKIDDLINDLPRYETAQEKLAAFLLEHDVWDKVWRQVWDKVRDHLLRQVWDQVGAQVLRQLLRQVGAQVEDQARGQVWFQVWDQIENQEEIFEVWDPLAPPVAPQVWYQVWRQVEDDLSLNFDFKSVTEPEKLREVLKPEIDYLFMVYQLKSIAMRQSKEFKAILEGDEDSDGFIKFIEDRITEEQAEAILENLKGNFPESPEGNYLVESQLKMLKRNLPN